MVEKRIITIDQIIQNPTKFTEYFDLIQGESSKTIVFRPLQYTDIPALEIFLENLSETTRRFATYPSYDIQCAQQFCNEIDRYEIFRMIATVSNEKIIAIFEFNLHLDEFDINRYRRYGIELTDDTDIQFAPCIADEYQNQNLGSKLLYFMIDLAKRLGKERMILWAGVLIDNQQAIRFYRKNSFQIFEEKYLAQDGYECYDAILRFV
jgi:diamine N-acetyltransferase